MDPQIQECLSCLICCFTIMFIIGMTGVFKGCNETSTNMCTNEVFTGTVYAINLDCCTDDGNCDCDGEVITAYIHAEHIDEFNVSTSTCRYWYYTESMKLSYEIGDEVTWLRKAHTTSCITFPTAEERFIGGIVLHRPERKMRQNAVMTCIFYNYVSSNLLNVPLLFSSLKYYKLHYKYLHKYLDFLFLYNVSID